MKKIPSLFARDFETGLVYDEVVPGSEWVLAGEGIPTEKIDGTCCLIRDEILYGRYTLKIGKTPPPDFEPVTEFDPNTGKQQGWVPVTDAPQWAHHREALRRHYGDGSYELLGPKVQGNPYSLESHVLIRHGMITLDDCERTFEGVKSFLEEMPIEGIVWWHEDGRMVKIKRRDYGLPWPVSHG